MNTLLEEIQTKARQLSAEERAELALRLIQSLDHDKTTSPEEWEATWLAECDHRLKRFESGEGVGIPLEIALKHARSQLR